jgi:hypothetical protein
MGTTVDEFSLPANHLDSYNCGGEDETEAKCRKRWKERGEGDRSMETH